MPIDSSIYGLIRAPQQGPGPLDMYAKGVQLSSMIDEQGLNQLKRKQVEQAMADEAATGEAYRLSGGDPVKLADILRGRGLYKPAMAAEKAALDARNTRATAGKTEAEALAKNVATLRDALVGVNDQAGYDAWREVAARLVGPDLVRSAPPQFSMEWKTQNLMKADDLIKRLSPELKMTDTGGAIVPLNPYTGAQQPGTAAITKTNTPGELLTDERTRTEGAANRGVTLRGQNLTDARAREAAAAGGRTYDADRGIVVDTRAGTAAPVLRPGTEFAPGAPIGPKDKQATDTENISAGYAARMRNSAQILADLEKKGIGTPELTESALSAVGSKMGANISMSPERQRYRQAQEDWVRAKLRKESGAVIADEEMDREIRVYFPQIGDDAATKAQKADSRKQAEISMAQAAGKAKIPEPVTPTGNKASGRIKFLGFE